MGDELPSARLLSISIKRNLVPDYWAWEVLAENKGLFRGSAKTRSDAQFAAYDKMWMLLKLGWH
jgi:hypothetical protein